MTRGRRRIVSRSGGEPHVPVRGGGDLRDVGFVAAHQPAELPARRRRISSVNRKCRTMGILQARRMKP